MKTNYYRCGRIVGRFFMTQIRVMTALGHESAHCYIVFYWKSGRYAEFKCNFEYSQNFWEFIE